MVTLKDLELKRKDAYFLLNFKQVEDFQKAYEIYDWLWRRTVLPYTIIYGLPDAIYWRDCPEVAIQEIVDRYGLKKLKEDGSEVYYRF